jgi:hypothetical protein
MALIAVIAIVVFISSWIQKWVCMRDVGYIGVFWTPFSMRWGLAFVVVSSTMKNLKPQWVNFYRDRKLQPETRSLSKRGTEVMNHRR